VGGGLFHVGVRQTPGWDVVQIIVPGTDTGNQHGEVDDVNEIEADEGESETFNTPKDTSAVTGVAGRRLAVTVVVPQTSRRADRSDGEDEEEGQSASDGAGLENDASTGPGEIGETPEELQDRADEHRDDCWRVGFAWVGVVVDLFDKDDVDDHARVGHGGDEEHERGLEDTEGRHGVRVEYEDEVEACLGRWGSGSRSGSGSNGGRRR